MEELKNRELSADEKNYENVENYEKALNEYV